jgi:hypothetical protein
VTRPPTGREPRLVSHDRRYRAHPLGPFCGLVERPFGMRRFRNYRIRAVLYAGRPNWTVLDDLTPP